MTNQGNIDNFRLDLKRLASLNNLQLDELKEIIEFCANFFGQNLPQKFGKAFNSPFLIQGFSGKTFKLARGNKIESQEKIIADLNQDQAVEQSQKEKIIDELKKQQNKILQENLFLSDFVAFLEQSSLQLAKFLDQDHKQALAKLGSDFFNHIGLAAKVSSSQILLKELQKLEDSPAIWQKVNSDLAQPMLTIIESQQTQFAKKQETTDQQKSTTSATTDIQGQKKKSSGSSAAKIADDQDSGTEEEPTIDEIKQTLPEDFSKEFNLARLDDHSKLYIRSLAIIAVNQSLQIQFANLSKEQLADLGFAGVPNFDQLSLESRQQLLSITFSKIESLLASGKYDLKELISTPSLRISFAKDTALKVMTDIRGGEIFAQELGQLTSSGQNQPKIKQQLVKDQEQSLIQDQLQDLSSQKAEAFFAKLDSQPTLQGEFVTNITRSFTRVTKNNFLNEWQKIVVDDKNAREKSFLARENILPVIDVFIQQNYPVSYIENFDWQRFQTHFGKEIINQETYLANEQLIKNLLISYWKTQRAEWSYTIHQGIDNELYATEDLENLWQDLDNVKDKQAQQRRAVYLRQLQQQARFNLINAEAVTNVFAGSTRDKINFDGFQQEQIDHLNQLNAVYQQSFLNIVNEGGPTTQQLTLSYYFPEEEYVLDNVLLQTTSFPQFSAYDLGALNYNQAFGPNEAGKYPLLRTLNNEGGIENQIQDGLGAVKNISGKAIDFLGQKAIRAGLDYATGGAFETLPEPIKQMIEQIAWGEIKKRLEPILKILLALATGALMALLALISKIVSFFGLGGGVRETSPIIAKKTIWSEIADATQSIVNPRSTAAVADNQLANRATITDSQSVAVSPTRLPNTSIGSTVSQVSHGVMTTATQAVITAFSLAAGGMLIYQTVLNSAFLTQFPTGGSRGGGTAVFCDDVVVGNLTYYSQKDYNNVTICGGQCTFGSSACGPVAIAMILNEDPITMSTREGFLVPGGCGATSCAGTALDPLINTLNNNGVNTVAVPTPSGSPGQITDEISNYLAEGNLILALTHTRGFGHYYVITCVESPGYVTAYDPWWGQNVVHRVVSSSAEGLISGTDNTYIRNMYLVQN